MFQLEISAVADAELTRLRSDPSQRKRLNAVLKALGFLRTNPRHQSLNTHEWTGCKCPHGDKLWEAYAENDTPAAYRIFFCYHPTVRGVICISAITPHP
jgi:hypothetical protein